MDRRKLVVECIDVASEQLLGFSDSCFIDGGDLNRISLPPEIGSRRDSNSRSEFEE